MPNTIPKGSGLASLLRSRRGPATPAAEFLDDRDRPEQDDERQDAPEREVAAEHAEDALPGRGAARCGRRVLAESRCVDAGVRVAAWSAQGGQRAPTTAVVVLDLLERPRR